MPVWLTWIKEVVGRTLHKKQMLLGMACVLVITLLYSKSIQYFYHFYPNWVNSELLINYGGGFVRRGLLGQIAFLTRETFGITPARCFLLLFSVAYLIQMFVFLWLSTLVRRKMYVLLFALSPALLLFPAYDLSAFGRKDVFITLGLLLHSLLVVQSMTSDRIDKNYAKYFITLIFPFVLITVFVHEVQAFFMLHHIILTLLAPSGRWKNGCYQAI